MKSSIYINEISRYRKKKEKNEMDSDAKSIAILIHASYQHVKSAKERWDLSKAFFKGYFFVAE
jgi:hypothetical protein